MNQIIHNSNSYDYKSSNNKKEISIPIFAIILPLLVIILFIVFFFKIYASCNNDTVENVNEQNSFSENIPIIEETQTQIQDNTNIENIEKDQEQEEQANQQNSEDKSSEEILYTAENGETYSIIGKLNIPSLNIEYPILSSTSTALLKISLNRYWGSYPNEVGNMVVVGHNYKNNKFFSNLSKINIGDIVKISDTNGNTLDYSVYQTDVIDPYDNSCTSQLTDGKKEVTLITCYYENGNPHATKRFIAKARAN